MVPPSPRLRRTVVVPFSSLARCEAWRVARPNLFGGGARPLATPAGLPSVGQPDAYGAGESRVPQRQRVSPRAAAPLCERSPHLSQQSRWRGDAAFWACFHPSTTALSFLYPRPRASAMLVPTRWLNCRCSWARRGGVGVEVRGASSQRWLCRVPLGGVGVVPCSFQRRLRGLPTPAPDWFVPCSSQKLLPLCPIGRGSRFVVRSSCRRCVLRAFHGFPARGRGDAGGEAAQNRARRFSGPTRLAEKTAALGFPPLAGVAPLL